MSNSSISVFRLSIKCLLLICVINILFSVANPMPFISKLTIYNHFVPGRKRLPYGDNPIKSYNLSIYNLEAMYASHELNIRPKTETEFRVIMLGDSATWGYLLPPNATLAEQITSYKSRIKHDRVLTAFNFGYPVMSLTKDLLLLEQALKYNPDLIVWLVTLESFPTDKQLYSPLLQNNPYILNKLLESNSLPNYISPQHPKSNPILQRSIIAQHQELADLLRLQLYGIMWAATGIDHEIPVTYPTRLEDLPDEIKFHEYSPPSIDPDVLAFNVIRAGMTMASPTKILLINEPIYISNGLNSDIRYNYYYPRWAYDSYRQEYNQQCEIESWWCLDLWNAIPPNEFTNTAIHMTPKGTALTAEIIDQAIQNWYDQ